MKRLIGLVLSLGLFVLSVAYAEDTDEKRSVASQEWEALVEPLVPLGEHTATLLPDASDPQLRQEFYQFLYAKISAGYMALLHADPAYPDFWPIYNGVYNSLAPNPDDVYYATPLDPGGVYKISGFRGTARIVDFQIGGGTLFPRGTGSLGRTYANYDLDRMKLAKDGSFDVVLSAERPPGYEGEWWKLDASASYMLVRQVSYDWLHEIDGRFAIERLDRPAIRPRPSAEEIASNLKQIAVWTESWTKFELAWPRNLRAQGLVNKVVVHDLNSVGGLSTQKYIEGLFELKPDEALIYETEVPERCRYWNIELTDELWSAVDWMNRQSHLNGFTAKLDKDGKFRAVISGTDPGVPNWLDSAGYAKGMFFGRWTECSSYPQPLITKVKFADIRHFLPADTPFITQDERDASIRLRRKGAQLRRRW